MCWVVGCEGIVEIGYVGGGFIFDNEMLCYCVLLQLYVLVYWLVINVEYFVFVYDGGYCELGFWFFDGWVMVQVESWEKLIYWQLDLVSEFILYGVMVFDLVVLVCYLSYFEVDVFVCWVGVCLLIEVEWELVVVVLLVWGNLQDSGYLYLQLVLGDEGLVQMFGDVWEWIGLFYVSYFGFQLLFGLLGEYNGKFMNGQWVLCGGSCVMLCDYVWVSYCNFFLFYVCWQFVGI